MPISISCKHCDWVGKVKDEMGGKTGKCPTCGEHIAIPRSRTSPPPVSSRPKSKPVRRDPDDEEEAKPRTRPAAKRSRDDEDERPRKSKRRSDDEVIPSTSRRKLVDDDEDDEPRPKKRKTARDDDDEPRPRKKKRKRARPRESTNSKKISAIGFGLLAVLAAGAWLAWMFLGDGRFRFYPFILLVIGVIGIFQGITGVGLGDSSDDDDDE